MHRRLIIIGSGPAGYTAAIYSARANLEPLVIAGSQSGGQLMITSEVENYPGFPEGIQGPELMERFRKQAERFGAQILDEDATKVDFSSRPFRIFTEREEHSADAVIVATGASAKWLGLPSELRLRGKGVSACATCDAFFLTKFANHVTVVHRRDRLRASKIMQEKAQSNTKISFLWNHVVDEVLGSNQVEGVIVRNVLDGKTSEIKCQGLFVAIGHEPATSLFRGQLEIDERGYIKVIDGTKTNVSGVFVAGDVHDYKYRQAVTAAGFGCQAALDAEKYLEEYSPESSGMLKITARKESLDKISESQTH